VARFAVMGSPINHSHSPTLHRAAFEFLEVDASYDAEEVNSLKDIALADFRGLSLTMPLKIEAFDIAHSHDDESLATGVSNTLLINNGQVSALNTDVYGIAKSVEGTEAQTVQIIGTGATAKSAALAVRDRKITFTGRNQQKVSAVNHWAESHGIRVSNLGKADLVIDTTPGDATIEYLEHKYVLDVAYSSNRNQSEQHLISGLEMLLHQAAVQHIAFSAPFVSKMIDLLSVTEVMRQALMHRVGEWSNA